MSVHAALLAATIPDAVTFAIATVISVAGALGVVLSRNPVHSALMLVMTLFGIAVLFVEENAQFLAAVQVIVYAGAIVVLFLFVIMLLGVDRREIAERDPLPGQRVAAIALGVLGLVEVILLAREKWPTGAHSVSGPLNVHDRTNVSVLGQSVFTTYLLPFEITSALLLIAGGGAVALARRPRRPAGEGDGGGRDGLPAGAGGGPGDGQQVVGSDLRSADVAGPNRLIEAELEPVTVPEGPEGPDRHGAGPPGDEGERSQP